MKLDDLNDLDSLGDLMDDPLAIYFEGGKKKKKKKKDKEESKKSSDDLYEESLKELSKKDLRNKAENLGIDLDYVDTDSKKALRKAIMKARSESEKAAKIQSSNKEKNKKSDTSVIKTKADTSDRFDVAKVPPYYFDEDTHDFIISDADDAPDMQVFTAMQALGKIRKSKRDDDGFAEMMDRITTSLTSGGKNFDNVKAIERRKQPEDVIDVDYTVVEEKVIDSSGSNAIEAIELSEEETAKLSADVDAALADLHNSTQQKSSNQQRKRQRR